MIWSEVPGERRALARQCRDWAHSDATQTNKPLARKQLSKLLVKVSTFLDDEQNFLDHYFGLSDDGA